MPTSEFSKINIDAARIGAETEKPLRDAGRLPGVPEDTKMRLDSAADKASSIVLNAYEPEKGIINKASDSEKARYNEARVLFGNNFIGLERVREVFGEKSRFDLNSLELPSLPPMEKLIKGKELGAVLALRVYEGGRSAEWKIFMPKILESTENKDYVGQTVGIRDFLSRNGLLTQSELEECTDDKLSLLVDLVKTSPGEAVKKLVALKINQNHRHSADTIRYFSRLIKFNDNFEVTKDPVKEYPEAVRAIGKFTDSRQVSALDAIRVSQRYADGWIPSARDNYECGVRIVL